MLRFAYDAYEAGERLASRLERVRGAMLRSCAHDGVASAAEGCPSYVRKHNLPHISGKARWLEVMYYFGSAGV